MAKREPLRPLHIPLSFDEAVKALLQTPPPKAEPKAEPKPKAASAKAAKARKRR